MSNSLPGNLSLPSSKSALEKLILLAPDNAKYSVEDFFRTPDKTGYQLSPDGSHLSFLGPYKRRQNIFIRKIESDIAIQITFEENRDISGYFWANDHRIVFIKDAGGDENFQLHAVDINGENIKNLTPFDNVRIEIIDRLPKNEDELIIGMNLNNPMLFEPFRINIYSGTHVKLADNIDPESPLSNWMTDHDGKLRMAFKITDNVNNTLLYRATEDEPFKEILTTNFKQNLTPLVFDFEDPNMCYVATNLGRDKSVICKLNLLTGEEVGSPLFDHKDVDVSSLGYSRKRKVLTTVSYTTDKVHHHFLDEERKKLQDTFKSYLPGFEIAISGHNKDEDKYLIRTYSDRSLGSYYFYDVKADKITEIVEVSPWLAEDDLSEMKPIKYTSRDGLTIHGYLTLPKTANGKNLPIIIHPHGGPWVRDDWGYNPLVQLLASRGYGVLQMNYRGSTGYGRKFWEQSFKQWGRAMQDDISDGVNWLISEGVADPKRVAIYGGSYGGYATLAGLAFSPDLYACGIDYVGVSNLLTFMKTVPPYWVPFLEMMYEMVGNPETEEQEMKAASPAFHVDKIRVPLFVAQGANDPRVNIDESDQIVESLRQRGVDVPYMVKYDEGHGYRNEENKFEFYKAMLGFLKQHLGS